MCRETQPLTNQEAAEYRAFVQARLDEVVHEVDTYPDRYPELKRLLNRTWRSQIIGWIDSIGAGKAAPRIQLHHLLYALWNEEAPFGIGVAEFETRLQTVREAVLHEGKSKMYRDTFGQLRSNDANNVHGAMFEIYLLYAYINSNLPHLLFPSTGPGSSSVDLELVPFDRSIFCEVTSRGFSENLDRVEGAINPYLRPRKMVEATLLAKMGPNGQLGSVAKDNPSLLFTCVGFDVLDNYYVQEMYNTLETTYCSAVIMFDRYHCSRYVTLRNEEGPYPLTDDEIRALKQPLEEQLNSVELRPDSPIIAN